MQHNNEPAQMTMEFIVYELCHIFILLAKIQMCGFGSKTAFTSIFFVLYTI